MRNNIIKYGIFLVGALSLLTFNALAISDPSHDSVKLANNVDKPINGSCEILLLGLTHEDLSNHSDMIVIGTVKEILPSKWNTIDGKRPNNTDSFSPFCFIYTDIVVNVNKYLKNPLSSKEVTVRVDGGTVGNDRLIVDEEPSFKTGEKVLLYLMKDDSPGTKGIDPEHFKVTGALQGKFTLTDAGKAVRPDENITLDELLNTIKQTDNTTNDVGMSYNKGTAGKQEENSNSTPETKSTTESKSTPLISSFWVLAALIGAVPFVRQRQK